MLLVHSSEGTGYPRAVGAESVDGYSDGSLPVYPYSLPLSNWNLIRQIDPATEAEAKNYSFELDSLQTVTGKVFCTRTASP